MSRQYPKLKGRKSERLCLGCRRFFPKGDLLRVAVRRDGQAMIDLNCQAGGRGAYVCPIMDCLMAAFKERRWAYGLRKRLTDEQTISHLMRPLAQQALWMTGDLLRLWQKGKASRQVSPKG